MSYEQPWGAPEPAEPIGAPPFYRRKQVLIPAGAALAVLVVAVAVASGSGDEPTRTPTAAAPSAAAPSSPTTLPSTPTPSSAAPSSAAASSAAPSPSASSVAAAPAVATQTFSGSGDKVVRFKQRISDARLMTTTWKNADGNITIYSLTADGAEDDLLVNAIDSYRGQTLFNDSGEDVAGLKIEGGGSWTVKLGDLGDAKRWGGSGTYSGSSDAVIDVSGVFEPLDSLTFVSSGTDSNVTMYAHTADDSDLVVNNIGAFRGEYLVPSGARLFVVSSDGRWTMRRS